MTDDQVSELKKIIDLANIASTRNIEILGKLSIQDREYFAYKSGTMVLYIGDEVAAVKNSEEKAALSAMPDGYDINQLNGLNIGCGNRLISPFLLPIDIMRQPPHGKLEGVHHELTETAVLAHPEELPFKNGSIDFIVSLHTLEHIENPIEVIHDWLDILKPGGGVGIVVPDWRYTWDSRNDRGTYSHKWNPTPDLIERIYLKSWSERCYLEKIDTYPFKLSFDFVLRKHGIFRPFSLHRSDIKSGYQRCIEGIFLE
jgi:SAM-dependent methyltransferase